MGRRDAEPMRMDGLIRPLEIVYAARFNSTLTTGAVPVGDCRPFRNLQHPTHTRVDVRLSAVHIPSVLAACDRVTALDHPDPRPAAQAAKIGTGSSSPVVCTLAFGTPL